MTGIPLRRLVSVIGLTVAIVTAVATPCVYFIHDYANISAKLTFKARLNAARVAQYIYTHNAMWQYQQLRLAELIQLPETGQQPIHQKIYDKANRLVLEEGTPVNAPTMVRSTPIVVSGATVGILTVEESLRPNLYNTGLVALLSSLIGFAAYFALRIFPLRVLDRTLGSLHDTQRSLSMQNERFDAALTNMSQGLCMFDANGKIVIFNQRVAEIYGLPIDMIKPGMTTPELMAVAFSQGTVADVDPEGTLALRQNIAREGKAGSMIERLTDGRSISISYRPMPDGGFVVTFEDITERLLAEDKNQAPGALRCAHRPAEPRDVL